ncbi:MAG TPA: glycosyltransferase family 4 protein [Armatimonadaceae bacterium]|nr:glycosyltransferase family 4 protein [Armatimonadaceae bacterium]
MSHGTPRTILYLDHTARWSGGEIALLRLLAELDRTQFTPVVVLAEEGALVERLQAKGIETIVLPLSGDVREVRKDSLGAAGMAKKAVGAAGTMVAYARKVARLAKERDAALIHCNSLKSDLYGAVAGRLAGIPVLWHVRDHIDPTYLPGPAVTAFRKLARALPTAVVTNSASTEAKLFPEGAPPGRAYVVHDGLMAEELTTPAPEPFAGWPADRPLRIGLVGRITRWKGQDVFLEAASRLIAAGDDGGARFVLVGSALFGEQEYEAQVRGQAEALGDRIDWMGFREDIPAVLRGLDIFVHASVTPEPFGQVVIEAMAEGLPVVATAGGGVKEIVRHGENGLLTPMGDVDALASALAVLIRDPALASRLARAGHADVRQIFTAKRSAEAAQRVYWKIDPAARHGARRRSQPTGSSTGER